jgi:hypothetical protein
VVIHYLSWMTTKLHDRLGTLAGRTLAGRTKSW